ncbi:MAG: hypothetical protein WKF66_10095 [Pedobacter sp.]
MNKQELKQKLDSLGIYPGFHSLDGDLLPDCIVLTHNYNHWEVFYFDERGNQNNRKNFLSESDACNYVYKHFQKQKEIETSTGYK